MTLNDFLAAVPRLFGYIDKAEANLAAESALKQANVELAAAKASNASLEKSLKDEQANSAKLTADLAAASDKVTKLEASVATLDKQAALKANEIIANAGLPKPVPDENTQNQQTSETELRASLAKEKDLNKRAELARQLRKLRGIDFSA